MSAGGERIYAENVNDYRITPIERLIREIDTDPDFSRRHTQEGDWHLTSPAGAVLAIQDEWEYANGAVEPWAGFTYSTYRDAQALEDGDYSVNDGGTTVEQAWEVISGWYEGQHKEQA
jgi:hypothetical protein